MALSRKVLKEQIEASKEAIKKIEDTKQKCEEGLDINKLVLEAFEAKLL